MLAGENRRISSALQTQKYSFFLYFFSQEQSLLRLCFFVVMMKYLIKFQIRKKKQNGTLRWNRTNPLCFNQPISYNKKKKRAPRFMSYFTHMASCIYSLP